MRRCITGAIVYALLLGSVVAGPTIIFTDTGAYVMTVGADGVPVTERADEVLDKRTGAPPPNPGPGPTPPPQPPPGETTAAKSERLARAANNPAEAGALAAVYALLKSTVEADPSKAAKIAAEIGTVRGIVLAGTSGGPARWKAWGEAIDADMGTNPKAQFFGDVQGGLAKAAGANPGMFDTLEQAARNNWERSVDALEAMESGRALDWLTIFQIIQQIIAFLQSLGIL